MCLACRATTCSDHGANDRRSPGWRQKSRARSTLRHGNAYRLAKEPKAQDCTTGPIANWPISTRPNMTTNESVCGRGLLIRRNIVDGDMAFFSTWCPAGTSIKTLVKVEGHRWAIEDSFETTKNELGLDHNETRSWNGWHRHVSLVMLAFAMMAAIRHHANATPPPKTKRRKTTSKTTRPHRH